MTKSLPYRTFEHMTNDKRREKKKKIEILQNNTTAKEATLKFAQEHMLNLLLISL